MIMLFVCILNICCLLSPTCCFYLDDQIREKKKYCKFITTFFFIIQVYIIWVFINTTKFDVFVQVRRVVGDQCQLVFHFSKFSKHLMDVFQNFPVCTYNLECRLFQFFIFFFEKYSFETYFLLFKFSQKTFLEKW